MPSERLEKILVMLQRTPSDPFLLYAAGMEYKKAGDHVRAIDQFQKTLAADPKYCYAFYQMGQTHELTGNEALARQAYKDGIATAQMVGDAHAQSELQAALDMMG